MKGPDTWSKHLYMYIAPDKVGMFRFLLEAQDNLGYMSVVDRWRAALQITFAPGQEREVREYLAGLVESLPFELVELALAFAAPDLAD